MAAITAATTRDVRVPLPPGAGVDAVHSQPVYSFAVTRLRADTGEVGTGLALTLGAGNDLVCRAAESLAAELVGIDIETLMAEFGARQRKLADHTGDGHAVSYLEQAVGHRVPTREQLVILWNAEV